MIFDSYDDTGFECRVSEIVGLEMHCLVMWAKVETMIDYGTGMRMEHSCLRLYGIDRGVMTSLKRP